MSVGHSIRSRSSFRLSLASVFFEIGRNMHSSASHVGAPTFTALLVLLLCLTRSRERNTNVAPIPLARLDLSRIAKCGHLPQANSTLRKCLKFAKIRTFYSASALSPLALREEFAVSHARFCNDQRGHTVCL